MDIHSIGGQHFYYLESCKRQLWLYLQKINLTDGHEAVELGKLIHEETFKDEKKEIQISGFKIDFVHKDGYVHETKSSKTIKSEHPMQPLFYAYYLRFVMGFESIRGAKIHHPLLGQVKTILLDDLRFDHSEGHVYLPVEQIDSLYVMNSMQLNTNLLEFFSKKHIPIHFFNYYGFYTGSFIPNAYQVSGHVLIRQALAANQLEQRMTLAKEFLRGAHSNMMKNIRKIQRDFSSPQFNEITEEIKEEMKKIRSASSIAQLMGIEGVVRRKYYQIIDQAKLQRNPDFVMSKRLKRPPNNRMNALISFVNSLVYTTVLSEIYHTHLNPTISFLHEPTERRYSLSLDISEIFKPLLADRLIFKLVNAKILKRQSFDQMSGICYLNEDSKRKVLSHYSDRLNTTIKHRTLNKRVSYRRLIRLECYKLVKHLLGEKKYISFKIWW